MSKKNRTSKFVTFQSEADKQHYWHLKAKNGEIIAQGEGYKTQAGALKGIKAVVAACKDYEISKQ
jgi:uncharacterized protein YegP (UPF0339 family)